MVVGPVDLVEQTLDIRVGPNWKEDRILAAKEKFSSVHELRLIFSDADVDFVLANLTCTDRRRAIGVVEGVTLWQRNHDLIFL